MGDFMIDKVKDEITDSGKIHAYANQWNDLPSRGHYQSLWNLTAAKHILGRFPRRKN